MYFSNPFGICRLYLHHSAICSEFTKPTWKFIYLVDFRSSIWFPSIFVVLWTFKTKYKKQQQTKCELAYLDMQDTRNECIIYFFILLLFYGKAQEQQYPSLFIDF